MPNASPIDIANIPPPPPTKDSPTSSTYTSVSTTTSGFSTSPRTPTNIPTMAFSPLTRTGSREQGNASGVGSGYFGGGAALGRTISGGTGAGVGGQTGLGLMGDKSAKGEGVLRRLSLSGMAGFRPSFLSPSSLTPANQPSIPAPLTQSQIRSAQDPFSGGAIHEEDHDHDHALESTDSVPGLTRAHSIGKGREDRPRRVSFGWPGFGSGSGKGTDEVQINSGLPAGSTDFGPLARSTSNVTSEGLPSPTPKTMPTKGRVSFAGSLEDSELGLGKVKSLDEGGQRRGRRNSEGGSKGRRGVSPMGEHILRGGGHF